MIFWSVDFFGVNKIFEVYWRVKLSENQLELEKERKLEEKKKKECVALPYNLNTLLI